MLPLPTCDVIVLVYFFLTVIDTMIKSNLGMKGLFALQVTDHPWGEPKQELKPVTRNTTTCGLASCLGYFLLVWRDTMVKATIVTYSFRSLVHHHGREHGARAIEHYQSVSPWSSRNCTLWNNPFCKHNFQLSQQTSRGTVSIFVLGQ